MKLTLTIALALTTLGLAIAPAAQALERVKMRTLGGFVTFHVPAENTCFDPGERFRTKATFRRDRTAVGRTARPLKVQFLREGRRQRTDRRAPFAYAIGVPDDAGLGRLEYSLRMQVRTRPGGGTSRTWVQLDRHVLIQPKTWASCA
ncbi:MAG: hypothetical protein GXY03_09505 [Solirubrobacterales bacterium]|nr:hypothetical protein [Solirubrobacterales bacterium]